MTTTSYKWQPGAVLLTQVNDAITAGNQYLPAIASNASGAAWLTTWSDPNGSDSIQGRVMLPDGTPLAGQFAVDAAPASPQYLSSVAGLRGGGYVVAYTDAGTDPAGDIKGRLFNADGSPAGTAFFINSQGNADGEVDVAALSDGGFVASWTRYFNNGDTDIRTAIFNSDGSVRKPAISTTFALTSEHAPSVAGLAGGGYVVAWVQSPIGSGNGAVYFRRSDANGQAIDQAPNGVLIDATGSINGDIQVAGLPDGGFVVAYTDNGWGLSGTEITARVYNADGSARTNYLLVNDPANGGKTAGDQVGPALAVLPNGDFVVGWQNSMTHLEYLQAYDAAGHPLGENKLVQGNVSTAEIAGGDGGRVAMVSESLIPDGSGGSIRSKIYELVRTIDGDNTGETIHATEDGLQETINGLGGDDTVVFAHKFNDYTVMDFGTKIVVAGAGGTTTLSAVEHLKFDDTTITPVNDGNALFDTLYYLSRNADVFHAGVNALDHFNSFGWHEGRDPNAFFDTSGYLAINKDVAASGVNPLEHYHQSGWQQGRDPSADFDTTLYLLRNPDVAALGADPLAHFLQFGYAEGRHAFQAVGQNIAGGFDAEYYLWHNPDVAAAGIDPLQHFQMFGWHEGRNPNAWFDTKGYLAHYADVAASGVNPLEHYAQFGWHEGRDPSAAFDTLGYLALNPDVAASAVNPLDHYLAFGIYENRQTVIDGVWH